YNDHILMACRSGGDVLWERKLPEGFRMTEALFNPQNSSLLLYGSDDGMNENLHYFNADGKILWKKKITDGALLSFTPEGNRIITSSWRHYKEDFSQMVFFDEAGEVFPTSLELGMRVERLLVSTSRRYIVVSGEDGYIDVIDLDEELARDNTNPSVEPPFYSPVATGLDKDQMAVTLFFNSDDALIPVSRLISQTESPQRAAIEELIRGPSRESALNRTISREGGIDVTFKKETGQLFLDLSPEAAQVPGSFQIISVLNSLRYTAGCLPGIKEIYLTVNKEPLEICGDDLVLEQPLEPYHWIDPLFFPVRVREHYYLLPREASDLEIERRDLCELLGAVVKQCRTFYFVPGDLDLIDVVEAGGVVTINLGPSFRMLFPENGGEEEHLQAALILDALFLTALENSDSYQAIINVEGENWIPPEGYPSLSFVIHESYYINPEF
ncbi:MAG: GerMN domain-containing protein, partial [Firmicutes bacterium]|nr:GerMN domain-containing protein [Bacillota bacterium]